MSNSGAKTEQPKPAVPLEVLEKIKKEVADPTPWASEGSQGREALKKQPEEKQSDRRIN